MKRNIDRNNFILREHLTQTSRKKATAQTMKQVVQQQLIVDNIFGYAKKKVSQYGVKKDGCPNFVPK